MNRVRPLLQLVRLPNLFTAVADVTAGFLYMGGRWQDLDVWIPLAGASACLYAGGVALNDVCDASVDAQERPERPIPSGRITRRTAAAWALTFLAFGTLLAAWSSQRAGIVAVMLTTTILLYDLALKSTPFGPWTIGLCRALNLSLGLSVHPTFRNFVETTPILLLITTYTASIGFFARNEAAQSSRKRLIFGTMGVGLSTAGLGLIPFITPAGRLDALPLIAILSTLLCARGLHAARTGSSMDVQKAVATFVTSLVLFDCAIAWAARGVGAGAVVILWILPTYYFRARFRMS